MLSGISLTSHIDSFFFPLERRHLKSEVCNARQVHSNRHWSIEQTKISRSWEVGFLLADCPAVSFRFVYLQQAVGTLYIVRNFQNSAPASKKATELILFAELEFFMHKVEEGARKWRNKWWKPAKKCHFSSFGLTCGSKTASQAKPLQIDVTSRKNGLCSWVLTLFLRFGQKKLDLACF